MGLGGTGLEGQTSGGGGGPDSPLILQGFGVVGAPELAFLGDEDTGLYRPAADQLGIVAGGVETARATAAQFIVSPGAVLGSGAAPSLAFGDGDTGLFESADDTLKIVTAGVAKFYVVANQLRSEVAFGGAILNEVVSGTNPTLIPKNTNLSTGIGSVSSDVLSLIANGSERLRLSSTAGNTITGNLVSATSSGPGMLDEGASGTNPVFVPNQADPDTGFTRSGVNQSSIVNGGVEALRVRSTTASVGAASNLLIWSYDEAALKFIEFGADDSAGVGFKTCRVTN